MLLSFRSRLYDVGFLAYVITLSFNQLRKEYNVDANDV